jgi:hypothetical protein
LLQVKRRRSFDDLQCNWSHGSDPRNCAKLLDWRIQDAPEACEAREQSFGGLFDIGARNGQSEEKLNHLMVGESRKAGS